MKGLFAFLLLALVSCRAAQTIPVTQSMPATGQDPGAIRVGQMWRPHDAPSYNPRAQYLYVTESKLHALAVYRPFRGSPLIRTVALDSAPFAVAVDHAGRIFISEQMSAKVIVLDREATHYVGELQGLHAPDGIAVDAHDRVYVADHMDVVVYAPGKMTPLTRLATYPNYAVEGIAVDRAGNVYETIYHNEGGELVAYAAGKSGSQISWSRGIVLASGVAVDAASDVLVANAGVLTMYVAPTFKAMHAVNEEGAIRFLTVGDDGSVYIPIIAPDSHVRVLPGSGTVRPFSIPADDAAGAAAGH